MISIPQISIKQAVDLKLIGYPQTNTGVGYCEPCDCYFSGKHIYYSSITNERTECDELNTTHEIKNWVYDGSEFYGETLDAPSLDVVAQWLRKNKKYHVMIDCLGERNYIPTIQKTNSPFDYRIVNPVNRALIGEQGFESYDIALSMAIDKIIEFIKKESK